MKIVRLPICALLLVLCACASTPRPGGAPGLSVISSQELPPPQGYADTPGHDEYRIAPLDTLSVSVFGMQELNRDEIQVDAGGRLSMPLVGSIMAAGMTMDQLEAAATERLRASYVRQPQVAFNLVEPSPQSVTVEGGVELPGLYPAAPDMSLIKSIAAARGPAAEAKLRDVVVFRETSMGKMAALYDYSAVLRGIQADPRIYPGDRIVVGESRTSELIRLLAQVAPILSTPLILLLQ